MRGELIHYLMLRQKQDPLLYQLEFPLFNSNKYLPQGDLNTCLLLESANGKRYILRRINPAGREEALPRVKAEYEGVGFLTNPINGLSLRNPTEQLDFAKSLSRNNIPAVVPLFAEGDVLLIEYLENSRTLSDYWGKGESKALHFTDFVIEELIKAHGKRIIIGDRWGPNELIIDDKQLAFIDFDMKIWGPEAIEFEMAGFLYFLSYFAQSNPKNNMKSLNSMYSTYLSSPEFNTVYNIQLLKRFLRKYSNFFIRTGKYQWKDKALCLDFFKDITNFDGVDVDK